MSNLLKTLIQHHTHCYFVSPHFDDAAFSAGGLMIALSGHVPITVINVFTECGDASNTLSAKAYLNQCSFDDAHKLYSLRRREDHRALTSIKANIVNMGYTDALWRQRLYPLLFNLHHCLPELGSLYPTYRFHITSGHIHPQDSQLSADLATRLKALVDTRHSFSVFCPLGWGRHVDHLLVKKACTETFGKRVTYWSDFPYFLEHKYHSPKIKTPDKSYSFPVDFRAKEKLCQIYASQFSPVFKDPQILSTPETYYHL